MNRRRTQLSRIAVTAFALASVGSASAFAQQSCERLKFLQLPQTTITSAKSVPAGPFKLSSDFMPSVDLPSFCRVTAELKPTSDSLIKIEVWMPAESWNQKFEQVGNGGLAGSINLFALANELKKGFAAAGTDDGHEGQGTDGSWALGHPERVKDFGYRAVHETSVAAKKIIDAYYQRSPSYAYFNGCSEGGREALMEAQRYPEDFNGILAGAPAHYWTQIMAAFAWNAQALSAPGAFLSEPKRRAVQAAALAACGAQDRVTDKFVKDPLRCHFDPAVLLCKSGDSDACLTQPQVNAMKKIYSGPKDSAGKRLSAGYEPGAEAEPGLPGISTSSYIFGTAPGMNLDSMFSAAFYSSFVFGDPTWKVSQLNFDRDIATSEAKVGAILNASNPDLNKFLGYGGKLIVYHGWNDGSPPPRHSVEYFDAVAAKMGGVTKTLKFYRLFLAPGMMHCGQGAGPDEFGNTLDFTPSNDATHNIFVALEDWVEKGRAPAQVVAKRHQDNVSTNPIEMTRPLCPYPQQAKWNGRGDTNDVANWRCTSARKNRAE